jgi:hypothetical protein
MNTSHLGLATMRPFKHTLRLEIDLQPDDSSCGPTCLHAVYRWFGDDIPLNQVIDEVQTLDNGGSLSVFMACHALRRGYSAVIYTYNLQLFDPTWFAVPGTDLRVKMQRQMERKAEDDKLAVATHSYLEFLNLGGQVLYEDLTSSMLMSFFDRSVPVITGLSATHLHRVPREHGESNEYDDEGGHPVGHFVVLHGLDRKSGKISVADPYLHTPVAGGHYYDIDPNRVICSIMLGVLTYDANILVIEPKKQSVEKCTTSL